MTNDTKPARKLPLGLNRWQGLAVIGALVVGGVAGSLITTAANVPNMNAWEAAVASRDTRISDMQGKVKSADAATDKQRELRMAALGEANKAKADLGKREAELTQKEGDIKAREEKLVTAEQQQKSQQFGAGVHVVGRTVEPGTYSTNGGENCYYSWKSGTGSDASIIDNNIVDGPATVTLNEGDVFETSSRCAKWTKTG